MSIFKTRQMMALEYGIDRKTFERRLKKAGLELPAGLISPKDQQRIYDLLGAPQSFTLG